VGDQVSHPYKTKGKIIVLYIVFNNYSLLFKNYEVLYVVFLVKISKTCSIGRSL